MANISITYALRGATGGGPGAPAKCSCHHIIARPMMYALGVLALAQAKRSGSVPASLSTISSPHSVDTAMGETKISGNAITVDSSKIATGNILPQIAWIRGNLFIGPDSTRRGDDPSQNNDTMPIGFPGTQKTAINRIIDAIKTSGSLNISRSEGTTVTISIDQGKLESLVNVFLTNISTIHTVAVYPSLVSDWCMKSGSKYYKIFIPATLTGLRAGQTTGGLVVRQSAFGMDSKYFKISDNKASEGYYGALAAETADYTTQQSSQIGGLASRLK